MPFLQRRCNCAFGDHIFSLLREKIWKKRTLENEIALTRKKACRSVVRVIVTLQVKERPSGGVLASFISLAPPQAAGLVRFVVPPFPTRIASLDSRGSPFFGIPLKTTKGKVIPLPWIYLFSKIENCCNVATAGGQGRPPLRFIKLKMFRISYVKYSTGAHVATRIVYRALKKPNSTVARRAFGLRTGERKYVKRNDLFFRA